MVQKNDFPGYWPYILLLVAVSFFSIGYLLAGFHRSATLPRRVLSLPDNAVLFVTAGDVNALGPLVEFAESHGLSPYVWDIDSAPAYVSIGDRNVPLAPPVLALPAYLCRASDADTVIGYFGADLNIFKVVVSRCRGYVGPVYVYDRNAGVVVEVNS